ncbi:hypothetical protein [Micromonospora sp. NBC_01796]|uniref:hypothetical protein n=1 Tax=Micromonospora sp. NBC_01796 TaxID=2975987 RepID=UPI002DDA8A44|nr:hypothetical protein [Micromonospora sp. NBC_01796]WSA88236.1 hypothetical protein OIE47_11805 [Micromonospora sp. NBC_01796]
MSGPFRLRVGEILDLTAGSYLISPDPSSARLTNLRVRVKHVPPGTTGWQGDWLSLLAVELLPGDVDGRDLALVVHRRALTERPHPQPPPATPAAPAPAPVPAPPVRELTGAFASDRGLHIPLRPMWFCRVDAMPWPCAEARLGLTEGYRGLEISLCCYLAIQFQQALTDLHTLNPDTAPEPRALYERFLGWVQVRRNP